MFAFVKFTTHEHNKGHTAPNLFEGVNYFVNNVHMKQTLVHV